MMKQIVIFMLSMLLGNISTNNANNNIVTVEKTGQGQPIILIHGMACSAEVWNDVADYYRNDYELHLVSIAGFGNNKEWHANHTLQKIKDEIIHYTKSQNLEKPILMGHSMGGFLSLWAASEEPDLFGKIISIDGLPYFPALVMPGITPETAAPIVKQMQESMTNQNPEMARTTQEMIITTMIGNESKREKVIQMGLNSNSEVIAQAMGEMYTTDIRNKVANISQPVLVFGSWYAYRDYGLTMELATRNYANQLKSIPDATLKMADTALHFVFFDDPVWFFQQVDTFLKGK